MEEAESGRTCEGKDSSDVPHMSMESVGNIDFFKCNKCPYMALTAKDIQFHWQTSHSKNTYKISDPKSITVKCPGCSGIFYSEMSLKTHLRSHHKMCAKDINKLVQNLIQQFKRNQEYIENMEVVIDGHLDVNENVPMLIEVPPDPKQVVIVNNNQPINVINIGGSTTNFIINTNNGINNHSNSYVSNKTLVPKCVDGITTKQSIIRNDCTSPYLVTPSKHIKETSKVEPKDENTKSKISSILYNKLKSTNNVTNFLSFKSILPAVQQAKPIEDVTQIITSSKSSANKTKSYLCCKDSTQTENVTYTKKKDGKTDISVLTTTSKEWVKYKNVTASLTPTNNCNENEFQYSGADYANNVFISNEGNIQSHEITQHSNESKENYCNVKNKKDKHRNKKTLGNKLRFHTNICGVSKCSVRLVLEDKLEYHRSCHVNGTKDLRCPQCENCNFSTSSSLHHHLWKVHKIDLEMYTCDMCQFKTFNKKQLSYHILTHSNERKYVCDVCSKTFKNSKQLSTHRTIHRRDTMMGNFTCDLCNIDLSNAKHLTQHRKVVHEKKKNFQCDICQHTCATKDSLRLHIIRHIGSKHLKCQYCGFKTGDRNVLRRHVQRHTNQKTYNCKYCSYTCIQAASFKAHIISKHMDKKDDLLFTCTQCSFTTFSKQKLSVHISRHKDEKIQTIVNNRCDNISFKNKRNKSKVLKCLENEQDYENIGAVNVTDKDIIIEVTDQTSTSTIYGNSDDNVNIMHSDSNISVGGIIENNTEANNIPVINGSELKDTSHYFSNIISSLPATTFAIPGSEMFPANTIPQELYDSSNKIESIFDSNSESAYTSYNNKNEAGYNSNMICNPIYNTDHQHNYLTSNVDTDDNDTYYPNYETNLVINEEVPRSDNTTNFNICAVDNATDGLPNTLNNTQPVFADNSVEKSKTDSIKVNSNIFVKDIVDLASSHIRTIPPNIYASDIQKSVSHTPIILINPKTQTNNRIMGANLFSSNIINSSYTESTGSSQMLHIPLQSSNTSLNNSLPRKKPKISVKSNLILKGPDRLNHFDLQRHCNSKPNEYINDPSYSLDNYNLPLDFITNSQTIESNNMNCTSDLLSKDLYNSEHNYLSKYLLNSDFPLPNIQAPIISNNTKIIQNNLNNIQTIPLDSNLTDMSDVKLENKPYLSNQSEAIMSNMIDNSVHDNPSMFYDVPIHVPIKFEQKMDMLSSYVNQNNSVFQNDTTVSSNDNNSTVIEELPQSFDNMNSLYNQPLYPFEDNYYFENDFITETLDGQEIIVLNDAWSDVKSLPNSSIQFDQNMPLPINVNEISTKEKPKIISEVHIAANASNNLSSLGDVRKIGLPFEFPLSRNAFNDSDFSSDQQDVIFDLDQY